MSEFVLHLAHQSFLYFSSDPEDMDVSEILTESITFLNECGFEFYPDDLLAKVTFR